MAIAFVGATAYAATSGALPAFTVGDLALVFAYRDGSNTAPSLPAGWTNVASSGANANSSRVGYRILQSSDTTTGTWTNATEIEVLVVNGHLAASPIGGNGAGGASSNQLSYTGFALVASGSPQGQSWVAGFAGSKDATDVNTKAVTGMTSRSGSVGVLGMHTHATPPDPFTTLNYTTTVGVSSGWRSYAVEIHAAAAEKVTGTARISLAAGQTPATRTGHLISVRARQTTASDGVLRVQLYEGASSRSAVLSTSLSTTLTDYSLAIADADATTIGSYADLEVRLIGASPAGNALVFEVAQASLVLPLPSAGTKFGSVQQDNVGTFTTQGTVVPAGVKQTGVARISLGGGFTPLTRTLHSVSIRARRTALQGKIRVQLYEGTTARSAVLETTELTTSLADYSLAVADADAATIVSYADLELRIWGYSSTGTATVFEVAGVALSLPASASGGTALGAVVLTSTSTVSAGVSISSTVYPSTTLYPHNVATVTDTVTVSAHGIREQFGVVTLPFTLQRTTSADVPSNNRTGVVLLASVATVAPSGTYERLGQSTIASFAFVSASVTAVITGQVAIASTATVTPSGSVPVPAAPPDFIDVGFEGMPDLLVAVAFTSAPTDPLQVYNGVSTYLRGINARRGRQFELSRIETGTESFVLDNRTGLFSPENTGSAYYPNIVPHRQVKWHLFWAGVEYAVFTGYLEGYPQEFPSLGYDSVVRQQAVDGFMPLSRTKFIPGSTVLTSVMSRIETAGEEVIDVGSTALPMPQSVPFDITIDTEAMTVTEIVGGTQYRVSRSLDDTATHSPATSVLTTAISFGQAYSGTRITQVLQRIGISAYDIDAGQSLLAPSDDLAGTAPLEHLTSVAEWEQGRFFVSKEGVPTFRDRHWIFKNELAARATFGDAGGSELPYSDIQVTHEDEKIVNIVRITPASGNVQEVRDEASIVDHFEQVFEKSWPLADDNEAYAAAQYLLSRYSEMQVRIPELTLLPRGEPTLLYPKLLAMELGQRFRVIRRPRNDATIDKQMIVEGVEHSMSLDNFQTKVQLSLADPLTYWQLGITNYGELGTNTRLAY